MKTKTQMEGAEIFTPIEAEMTDGNVAVDAVESAKEIKNYLKFQEILEHTKEQFHEMFVQLDDPTNLKVKFKEDHKALLDQILLTIFNHKDVLEKVIFYMIEDFNFDVKYMETYNE